MGVKDVACHKKRRLEVEGMTKSQYVYKTLYRFRAGNEAGDILAKTMLWLVFVPLSRRGTVRRLVLVFGCLL